MRGEPTHPRADCGRSPRDQRRPCGTNREPLSAPHRTGIGASRWSSSLTGYQHRGGGAWLKISGNVPGTQAIILNATQTPELTQTARQNENTEKSYGYSSRILFPTPAAVCGEDQRRQQRRHLAVEQSCTFHTFGERWREPSYNSSWWATDHAFNSFRVTGEIGNDSWETAEYREKPAAITRGGLISGKFRNRLPRNDCNSELNQRFRS